MSKTVLFLRDEKKRLTAIMNLIPDWEGFDKLINYLEIHYKTTILESCDGPDARRWIIKVNGEQIELIHDDGYGNYFLAPTIATETIVRQIGLDLGRVIN